MTKQEVFKRNRELEAENERLKLEIKYWEEAHVENKALVEKLLDRLCENL